MMLLDTIKIVTPEEMRFLEAKSIEAGHSSEGYMQKAGEGIAAYTALFIKEKGLKKEVTLVTGKGNNGGDAYVAGLELLKRGFAVKAFYLYDSKECSELNQKYFHKFKALGGRLYFLQKAALLDPYPEGVLLDGLLGTGFQGCVEGLLKEVIDKINTLKVEVLAIDIPSGLQAATGTCIRACQTLYLGMPKEGFFLGQGYESVGKLVRVDFGLPKKYEEMAKSRWELFLGENIALPKVQRTRHKYQRGYVVALAGSIGMEGAASLACLAGLRAGAGIVRLFHPQEIKKMAFFQELLTSTYEENHPEAIVKELSRAKAFLVGPGLGKEEIVQQLFLKLLEKVEIPCVIDADALEPFAKRAKRYPKQVILTPHLREMMTCLGIDKIEDEKAFLEACQAFATSKQVTLVLKGAPTKIFSPDQSVIIVARGDPGMATAGAGDVLTGVLAALLAQGLSPKEAAVLGVYFHARAGELAAAEKTSYCMIASDLIDKLPEVFQEVSSRKTRSVG